MSSNDTNDNGKDGEIKVKNFAYDKNHSWKCPACGRTGNTDMHCNYCNHQISLWSHGSMA